jgi:hypothetical protein
MFQEILTVSTLSKCQMSVTSEIRGGWAILDGRTQRLVRAACSHIPNVRLHSCMVPQHTLLVTQSTMPLLVGEKKLLCIQVKKSSAASARARKDDCFANMGMTCAQTGGCCNCCLRAEISRHEHIATTLQPAILDYRKSGMYRLHMLQAEFASPP